ncbi:MAG: phosphoribosylformylglycinamidine synthase [Tissierellia bacterium]|nr:phosphoribosylformylglycinamidine synthase [Tissierellia bacterium]
MKILIVGSGGREHALGLSLAKNRRVEKLYFAPGNGGTLDLGENIDIKATDLEALVDFAKKEKIDYTVCGPEDPLTLGIADRFEEEGLAIFGPRKASARLEGSKDFAKDFCVRHGIKTADYQTSFDKASAQEAAYDFLKNHGVVVIKADGLAAGKGVAIVKTQKEADDFLARIFDQGDFGEKKVVVEEFIHGFEMSLLAFTDSETIRPLASVKDHKEVYEGDRGPNTGGMGTYSPNLQALPYMEEIDRDILKPFLKGLQADGLDFRGLIFIGLMIGDQGIYVLEFNTRFGDPETQSLLQRLDTDLLDLMEATSQGKLSQLDLKHNDKKVVSLTLASQGYPLAYEKGHEISGLDQLDEDTLVFHAGTKKEGDKILTDGGRVLTLTVTAPSFEEAIGKVYDQAEKVDFQGKYYRKDIGPMVERIYVRRKAGYNEAEEELLGQLNKDLGLDLEEVAIYDRFDLEGLRPDQVEEVARKILADPHVENIYRGEEAMALQKDMDHPLVLGYQAGQFDQREDLILQTLRLKYGQGDFYCKIGTAYDFRGQVSPEDMEKIRHYLMNPIDQEERDLLGIPTTLKLEDEENLENPVLEGFRTWDPAQLEAAMENYGLAMNLDDIQMIQDYFKEEGRDINITELMILDTYWSDHCRHTTFNTQLDVQIGQGVEDAVKEAYKAYLEAREEMNRTKPVSLMDLGTIVAKVLKKRGIRTQVEDSQEVNACSIHINVEVEDWKTGQVEEVPYLLMFKNETHNHPTEVEPFGGAATCLGGCIRDPLSGRGFVYQAMRVTGAGDPRVAIEDTLENKLPQKKITRDAANGYSSYGNQIGIPAGLVEEVYHPGYVAKRMEMGALVAAAPLEDVVRQEPQPGDLILLIGGRTGRDGVGGATGSSQEQDEKSLETASAEVQKGNAPIERRIIRLYAKPEISRKIKRSNDFGAGGVSVAIGELADGLRVQLDKVPVKYKGLTPGEIALSESQERMAVVIAPEDLDLFEKACQDECVEMTPVAVVTQEPRMKLYYKDELICDIARDFIDKSGAPRFQEVLIEEKEPVDLLKEDQDPAKLAEVLGDLNVLSQKNLVEKFDASAGGGTLLQPLGGKNQITPVQAMAAYLPVREGQSRTASLMSYGYNPRLLSRHPFTGGYYAVVESLAKLVATGGRVEDAYLSFQEFFENLGQDPKRWAKPLEALLGAFRACMELEVCPIGGKDSMSGSFKDIDVPPTLVSFAVASRPAQYIVSPELKSAGNKLGLLKTKRQGAYLDTKNFLENCQAIYREVEKGNIQSMTAVTAPGSLAGLYMAAEGNGLGFDVQLEDLYSPLYGDFIVEVREAFEGLDLIGQVEAEDRLVNGTLLDKKALSHLWQSGLDEVFPPMKETKEEVKVQEEEEKTFKSKHPVDQVRVLIPVIPGGTGEGDLKRAFEEKGALVKEFVFKDHSPEAIEESIKNLAQAIKEVEILALPGAYSFTNQADGAGKYLRVIFERPEIKAAIQGLLEDKDGLVLALSHGFQALLEAGYFGELEAGFTLNESPRHIARMVATRALRKDSPWLSQLELDKSYLLPISQGEGRFYASKEALKTLEEGGQIAAVYEDNLNGSLASVESLLSPCKKILGKMGHVERLGEGTFKNIPDLEIMPIIEAGLLYFKK